MKTTAVFRTQKSKKEFLFTFYHIEPERLEEFRHFLGSQRLDQFLIGNFADKINNSVGYESRTNSSDKLAALKQAIEQFCEFYRISYHTEQLPDTSNDEEMAVSQAG
jgi:hypothetical protein